MMPAALKTPLALACAALLFSGRLGVVSVMALAAAGGLVRHLAG